MDVASCLLFSRLWNIIVKQKQQVEAVKHFLYGITIDEGADGLRAISLAWDVLYPEVS